jgi:hypothetical protein
MTQDETILMADASGISLYGMGLDREKFIHYLESFAKLVAQHEREECAKLAEQRLNWSIAFTIRARSDTSSKHVDITEEHKHDN